MTLLTADSFAGIVSERMTAEAIGLEFDLIVEDGSHLPDHQVASLDAFAPFLKHTGVYVLEDIEGAIQTADIEIEAKELWVVVDAEGAFTLSYEKPAADAVAAPEKAVEEAPVAEPAQADLTWLWIAIAAVVVAGGTAGGIAIAKKKKKAA